MFIEMQKQQILKIIPYAGFQAAGLRAPGARIDTEFVEIRKYGFQTPSQFLSQKRDRLKFGVVN